MNKRFASLAWASNLGLGSFRFLLSFFVVISHLWFKTIQGYAAYAVWGFFLLSGYLMAYILRHKYGFSGKGLRAYAKNRCLRILPLYYLSVAFGVVTILSLRAYHSNVSSVSGQFVLPQTLLEWAFPLTLCKLFPVIVSPMPVANALGIEVCAYFLMPLLARWRSVAAIAFVGSLALNCYLKLEIESFGDRYNSFWTCLAPFAAGALLVHYRATLRKLVVGPPFLSVVIWLIYGLTVKIDPGWPWSYGLYVSMIFSAWVVLALVEVKPNRSDTLAGDLSYPIYLFHFTIGLWFYRVFGYSRPLRFFVVSFAVTLLVSWLLVRYFEKPFKTFKAPPAIKPLELSSGDSKKSAS